MLNTISIITPSFNQGKYIERTLQSVLSQDIPLDYVVVDGASTDETLAILKRYAAKLRFISEVDRGQAHAVNKGIMMTRGNIIGWLNSDDIYYPHAVKSAHDYFAAHPEIDILYGKSNHIDEHDQLIEPYPTEEWNFNRFKQTCYISQPAVFFRRRVIERSGLLNEKLNFCLDYEYWIRLAQGGAKFAYVPELLAATRLYPATKTVSSPEKAHQEAMQMLKKRLGYVPELWLIHDTVATLRKKPQTYFLKNYLPLAILFSTACATFRWNGFVKGLKSCLVFPGILNEKLRKKRSTVKKS